MYTSFCTTAHAAHKFFRGAKMMVSRKCLRICLYLSSMRKRITTRDTTPPPNNTRRQTMRRGHARTAEREKVLRCDCHRGRSSIRSACYCPRRIQRVRIFFSLSFSEFFLCVISIYMARAAARVMSPVPPRTTRVRSNWRGIIQVEGKKAQRLIRRASDLGVIILLDM